MTRNFRDTTLADTEYLLGLGLWPRCHSAGMIGSIELSVRGHVFCARHDFRLGKAGIGWVCWRPGVFFNRVKPFIFKAMY